MPKPINRENGFTLIELVMVIVLISILSAVAIPKYMSMSLASKNKVASGICGALNSSIMSLHGNYLVAQITYDVNDIISNLILHGGLSTANFTFPSANEISFNYKGETYTWNYIPQNGDIAAIIECGGGSDDDDSDDGSGDDGSDNLVTICHKPGTPAEKTLTIPESALEGHLGHGDYIGSCEDGNDD